jgi:DNA mismatch endonuclease (patch repair protein)
LVFARRRKLIFVHGCFWHRHRGCGRLPKSKLKFWLPKLTDNRKRDLRAQRRLRALGWSLLVIWECQLRDCKALTRRIEQFLEGA